MRNLDWVDIGLHLLGAFVIVFGFGWLFGMQDWALVAAAVFNAVLWPVREWWQDMRRNNVPAWPERRSLQKDMEAWPPAAFGFVVMVACMAVW